jgi:hypothetical protein
MKDESRKKEVGSTPGTLWTALNYWLDSWYELRINKGIKKDKRDGETVRIYLVA